MKMLPHTRNEGFLRRIMIIAAACYFQPCTLLANDKAETPCQLIPMIILPMTDRIPSSHIEYALRIVNRTPAKTSFSGPGLRSSTVFDLDGKKDDKFGAYSRGGWGYAGGFYLTFDKDYCYIAPRADVTLCLDLASEFQSNTLSQGIAVGSKAILTINAFWGSSATVSVPEDKLVKLEHGLPPSTTPMDEDLRMSGMVGSGKEARIGVWLYVTRNGVIDTTKLNGWTVDLDAADVYFRIRIANPSDADILIGERFLSPDSWKVVKHNPDRPTNLYAAKVELPPQEQGILQLPVFARVAVLVPFPKEAVLRAIEENDEIDLLYEPVPQISLHLKKVTPSTIEFLGLPDGR